jgi:F-type H+-transporting ATPase subunit b
MADMMRRRREKIKSDLDAAEDARQNVAKIEQDYRAKLAAFEQRTQEVLERTRQEGAAVRDDIVKAAQKEAEEIRQKAKLQLQEDKKELLQGFESRLIDLSLKVTEKVLRRSVDPATHEERFREMMQHLEEPSK